MKNGEQKQVLEEGCAAGSPARQVQGPVSMAALGWRAKMEAAQNVWQPNPCGVATREMVVLLWREEIEEGADWRNCGLDMMDLWCQWEE